MQGSSAEIAKQILRNHLIMPVMRQVWVELYRMRKSGSDSAAAPFVAGEMEDYFLIPPVLTYQCFFYARALFLVSSTGGDHDLPNTWVVSCLDLTHACDSVKELELEPELIGIYRNFVSGLRTEAETIDAAA